MRRGAVWSGTVTVTVAVKKNEKNEKNEKIEKIEMRGRMPGWR